MQKVLESFETIQVDYQKKKLSLIRIVYKIISSKKKKKNDQVNPFTIFLII